MSGMSRAFKWQAKLLYLEDSHPNRTMEQLVEQVGPELLVSYLICRELEKTANTTLTSKSGRESIKSGLQSAAYLKLVPASTQNNTPGRCGRCRGTERRRPILGWKWLRKSLHLHKTKDGRIINLLYAHGTIYTFNPHAEEGKYACLLHLIIALLQAQRLTGWFKFWI